MDAESILQDANKFLKLCTTFAANRAPRPHIIMIPNIDDINRAADESKHTNIDAKEIRLVLIDTALGSKWLEPSELYTGDPVCTRYDMKITLLENTEVFPIVELVKITKGVTQPSKTWHRSEVKITNRARQIELDHAHRMKRGFAFIELNVPADRQETTEDDVIYVAQIVGFCVEESKLLIESL